MLTQNAVWLVVFSVVLSQSYAVGQDPNTSQKAREILNAKCTDCHGKVDPEKGLNVLDYDLLISSERKIVVPRDLNQSRLWLQIGKDKKMPPDEPLSDDEIAIIKKWIEEGAESFALGADMARPLIKVSDMFKAMNDDLKLVDLEDRQFKRYFTITHLHNNITVSNRDLRKYRAGLSKQVNSLSWEFELHIPTPIDANKTIFRIDLRDLRWEEDELWREILKVYPYGISYDSFEDRTTRQLASEVYEWTGTELPFIRADWFVATASIPPLYHVLLRIPKTDRLLEEMLGVDFERNFNLNRLARAGFNQSKVSNHNRLVERHKTRYGAYWKSYDFKSSANQQRLVQFPLGPLFTGNRYEKDAFIHDGGEMIFNLPNKLQGYMITDGKGTRIDAAPIEVVEDTNKPLGSSKVLNGLSCMVCHKDGMKKEFTDVILGERGIVGPARSKVEQLYVSAEKMQSLLEDDERRFLGALDEAIGVFLKVDEDKDRAITDFAEPIGAMTKQFSQDIALTDVASELYYERSEDDLKVIFDTQAFKTFGLGVLGKGARIKRETWQSLNPYSEYHDVTQKLDLGTPYRVFP